MPLVLYELADHIATITLNRPDALNALSRDLVRELRDAYRSFRTDDEARVAIVTGAGGRAFSAGADLKEMSATREAERAPRGEDDAARRSVFAQILSQHAGDVFAG